MRKIKFFGLTLGIITIVVMGLGGCTSSIPPLEIYHDTTKKTGSEVIRTPQLNEVKTVEIGENIYQKINLYIHDTHTVTLLEPAILSSFGSVIINGSKFKDGSDSAFLRKWYKDNWNTACYITGYACVVDIGNTGSFTHIGNGSTGALLELNKPSKYKIIPTPPTYNEDSFKYQVLYQGRIGNKIKISFREFKDDMARLAFTQDIEYELDKNGETIVGFKGLRIKVIKATNINITYSVIQDYN